MSTAALLLSRTVSSVSPGRRAALEILEGVERGRRMDLALEDAFDGAFDSAFDGARGGHDGALSPADRSWAHACAYGTVRLRGRLDHLLDRFLARGIESVDGPLLSVLRMGAYQLLYMDGVPDYAALSQTVDQAKEVAGRPMGGLVNGVLRTLQREVGGQAAYPDLFPDPDSDPAAFLSTWGSHPRWLVERWLDRYGTDGTRTLVEWDNEPPPLYVRPLGIPPDRARDALAAEGVESEPVGRGTGSLRVLGGASPSRVLELVPAVVQDPGASLVVAYAAPEPGARIADLCAAPGGKALVLAAAAGPGGRVVAGDLSVSRLALLRESLNRFADPAVSRTLAPVYMVVTRGEIPPVAGADLVLLDVPCSGTGTLRRNPDGRWRLDPGDVERLAGIQRRILEGAADSVRPGGLLVYSTCTLEPEENEEVVRDFLERDGRFRLEPSHAAEPPHEAGPPEDPGPPKNAGVAEFVDGEGFLRVLPHEAGFDGAFAARMRRMESTERTG